MVAEPPRLAQKISAMIMGTGLNFRSRPSSTVAAARNRITVMLSMTMARMLLITMKTMKSGTVRYFTSLASSRQSQRKKPAFPIPSTISIMPAMNRIVDQLIPEEDSPASPASYQKLTEKKFCRLRVFQIAAGLFMQTPNTSTSIRSPQTRDTTCLSIFSLTIKRNIAANNITAKICAAVIGHASLYLFFFRQMSRMLRRLRKTHFPFIRTDCKSGFRRGR